MILSKCSSDHIITLLKTLQLLLISFRVKGRVSTRACMTPDDLQPSLIFFYTPPLDCAEPHCTQPHCFRGDEHAGFTPPQGLCSECSSSRWLHASCLSASQVTFPVRHSLAILYKTPNSLLLMFLSPFPASCFFPVTYHSPAYCIWAEIFVFSPSPLLFLNVQ